MGVVILPLPLCWFSFNSSKMIKAVTLGFCSIHNILLETFVPNLVSLTRPSLQILSKNSDGGISNFWILDQSLIKENCHNSRSSDDIDMKLGPVTELNKRNKATSKKFDDDAIYKICGVFVIFHIYGQFGAIWKSDFRRIVCKTYIFINDNLLFYKNWKHN